MIHETAQSDAAQEHADEWNVAELGEGLRKQRISPLCFGNVHAPIFGGCGLAPRRQVRIFG
jgi:hypothetical protein